MKKSFFNIGVISLLGMSALLMGCKIISHGPTWELVWSDEFDYVGLPNEAKWNYDTKGNEYGWAIMNSNTIPVFGIATQWLMVNIWLSILTRSPTKTGSIPLHG